jgi:hypothetical protein
MADPNFGASYDNERPLTVVFSSGRIAGEGLAGRLKNYSAGGGRSSYERMKSSEIASVRLLDPAKLPG